MDGFSSLDEKHSQNDIAQRMESIRRTWQTRSTLEKGLLIAVMALALLSLGLIIGLAASASGVKDTRDNKTRDCSILPKPKLYPTNTSCPEWPKPEPPSCPTCPSCQACPSPTESPPCPTCMTCPEPTGCTYSGMTYSHGDHFTPDGGCYSCICQDSYVTCTGAKVCNRTRTASQSSHHDNYRPASQAIDGDPNTIAHTAQRPEVPNPWWKLEYECAQTFTAVTVTNRNDCCYHQLGNLVITIDEQVCGRIGQSPWKGVSDVVKCGKPLTGKTLKIQKEKEEVLNLAEVMPTIVKPNGC